VTVAVTVPEWTVDQLLFDGCCADPIPYDDNYTTGFGQTLKVAAPGLLANDSGGSAAVGSARIHVELVPIEQVSVRLPA
jgi:hypothetical protein